MSHTWHPIHCYMQMRHLQVACSVWTREVTLVLSRPPLISQEFGQRGATTYVLQQDGGDSNVRYGEEAVQSCDAHVA